MRKIEKTMTKNIGKKTVFRVNVLQMYSDSQTAETMHPKCNVLQANNCYAELGQFFCNPHSRGHSHVIKVTWS